MLKKLKLSFSDMDLSRYEQVTFPGGTVIFNDGDPADAAYIIEQGLVEIAKLNSAGEGVTLAILRDGVMFGELALISNNPRSAGAKAMADTTCRVLRGADFESIVEGLEPLARNLLGLLINTLYRSTHTAVANTERDE